jgi:hypothetical protein
LGATVYLPENLQRIGKRPQGFFNNKRKKDVVAAAAPEETGGRNKFRRPLKYDLIVSAARSRAPPAKKLFASGEKDESGVFNFFDKLVYTLCIRTFTESKRRRYRSSCGGETGRGCRRALRRTYGRCNRKHPAATSRWASAGLTGKTL